MFDLLADFFYRYYVVPGYNIVNTLTYGLFLGVTVFYLIPRMKCFIPRIDLNFVLSLVPFILYGASTRELVDHGFGLYAGHSVYPQNFYLVSPWIYFTMFFLTSSCLVFSLLLQRRFKVPYHKVMFSLGSLLFLYNLYLILSNVKSFEPLVLILVSFAVVSGLLFLSMKLFRLGFLWHERNYMVALAHLLDASTTFVGIDFYHNVEQHVVPNYFIGMLNTAAVMFPLKALVVLPALYLVDKEMKNDEFGRRFIKLVIIIIGLGPAIRNTVLMLLS
ncbi:MAG: DUF63 family protein [Candidatus Altiarchaeota archaeon]|nr:DUF63 family protein [Candidatus Altiarchaeota archaeon]